MKLRIEYGLQKEDSTDFYPFPDTIRFIENDTVSIPITDLLMQSAYLLDADIETEDDFTHHDICFCVSVVEDNQKGA